MKQKNTKQKEVQDLPAWGLGRSCISEVQGPAEPRSNTLQWPEKQWTPRWPKRTARLTLWGFQQTQTGQNCCWWGGQEVLYTTV